MLCHEAVVCVSQVQEALFCAGQIALIPCSMQLLDGPPALQARLCFSHMEKVLRAVSSGLTLAHVLQAHIYVTHLKHTAAVTAAWSRNLQEVQLNNNKAGESHAAKMRIVSNGVQPYIVQTGVDTDGETQEEVTTFRMKLDVSEWLVDKFM
ncbi:hypothetical protein DPX16_2743 [Anabarilius grahami]|uniref:Uncharacterized protein n=1 Tax=Anabarilius grahami TaxID=495550 RepID=A0A3N0XJE4_ANAGA|nr:hypothetical protein DPX16_2743 [Anabarilius grahami]